MLLELMKFVNNELVVRLLKVKLFVNWTPLILLTNMLVELMKFVNNELVVRLLNPKLLLSEFPVNWKPLILLTTILVALTNPVKSVLVVRLLKATLLLSEFTILPSITIFEDVIVVIDETSGSIGVPDAIS